MGRVLALANQKGGVGKTTTAVNLAACMAERGQSVLLVDIDPQGNATQGVGIEKEGREHTVYNVLVEGIPLENTIVDTSYPHLQLAPAHRDLVGAEVELVDAEQREFRLRHALDTVRERYAYIFLDCPPSLGLLTLNGLVAAQEVIVPLQCEYYALEGLSELLQTILLVRDRLNPELDIHGVLLTMYQHTNLSRQVVADVRAHLGKTVFETIIPRNVSLSEAPSFGAPIIHYEPRSAGSLAYRAMAQEVETRVSAKENQTR